MDDTVTWLRREIERERELRRQAEARAIGLEVDLEKARIALQRATEEAGASPPGEKPAP